MKSLASILPNDVITAKAATQSAPAATPAGGHWVPAKGGAEPGNDDFFSLTEQHYRAGRFF